MAAISNNTESWSGHTKSEVEAHIKARLNNTVAASSIKALGFAQDVMYNPATDTYNTYIAFENNQTPGESAVFGISESTSNGNRILTVKLRPEVIQKRTTSGNWYPIAIAGAQYANLTSGYPYPVYYSQSIILRPSTGSIMANHYYKSDTTKELVAANVANFEIKVVSSQSAVGSESNILYIVVPS